MNQLISNRGAFCLLLIILISLLNYNLGAAQTPTVEYPSQGNFFTFSKDFIKQIPRVVVEATKKIGDDFFEAWRNIHRIISGFWQKDILPTIKNKVKEVVETKKPIIKEEFQKEKEEMKQEIINLYQGIWNHLKEIVI